VSITETISSEPILSVGTGITVTVIGYIIVYEYRRKRESTDEIKEWYRDALALIGQLQKIGHQSTGIQQYNTDALQEKLDPLAADLRKHAETAPDEIPHEARNDLAVLSAFATGIVNLSNQYENLTPIEIIENLQEHVKEQQDRKYDIDDVNEFIEGIDIDDLANQMENRKQDKIEVDDELLEEVASQLSDESIATGQLASIDDAAELPFDKFNEAVGDDGFFEEYLDDTMRVYSRFILLQVSSEVYETMEEHMRKA